MPDSDEREVDLINPELKRKYTAAHVPSTSEDTGIFADGLYCNGRDCPVVLYAAKGETFEELRAHALARLGWVTRGESDFCQRCVRDGFAEEIVDGAARNAGLKTLDGDGHD